MKVIAVDFDGTIATDEHPEIGKPIRIVIDALNAEKAKGAKLILWTCRRGKMLDQAVEWCKAQGLEFDAVNENLPELIERFGGDTRKVYADVYVDDKAANIGDIMRRV